MAPSGRGRREQERSRVAGRGFGRDSVFAGAQHSSGFGVSGSSAAKVGWCACAERVTRCVCRVRAITFNRFGHSESTAVMPNRFGHSVRSRALLQASLPYTALHPTVHGSADDLGPSGLEWLHLVHVQQTIREEAYQAACMNDPTTSRAMGATSSATVANIVQTLKRFFSNACGGGDSDIHVAECVCGTRVCALAAATAAAQHQSTWLVFGAATRASTSAMRRAGGVETQTAGSIQKWPLDIAPPPLSTTTHLLQSSTLRSQLRIISALILAS